MSPRWRIGSGKSPFVVDSSFAPLDLLYLVSSMPRVALVTRLRLEALVYDPVPSLIAGQTGRPRVKSERRPFTK